MSATTLDPVLKKVVDDYLESLEEIPGVAFKSKYGVNGVVITVHFGLLGADIKTDYVDITISRNNEMLPDELPIARAIGGVILEACSRMLHKKLRAAELMAGTVAKPKIIVPS